MNAHTPTPGQLMIHRTSGKFYRVCAEAWAVETAGVVYCTGFRNGKEFGPIRKVKVAALAKVQA